MDKILNHNKSITTRKFNKLSGIMFDEKLKQANLATKHGVADFILKDCQKRVLKLLLHETVVLIQNWLLFTTG